MQMLVSWAICQNTAAKASAIPETESPRMRADGSGELPTKMMMRFAVKALRLAQRWATGARRSGPKNAIGLSELAWPDFWNCGCEIFPHCTKTGGGTMIYHISYDLGFGSCARVNYPIRSSGWRGNNPRGNVAKNRDPPTDARNLVS